MVSASSVRLTRLVKRAGAAKYPPGYLLPLLGALPPIADPNVLIGAATADDAAVYRIDDERALVLTTDFMTPIVDDPYEFGQVACADALSDVYAMGGRPLAALSLVGFPEQLDASILADVLRGGADKAREAGIDVVGGHTMKTDEPIYGLAVTGMVHPERVVSNAGARDGDRLVLTKPIGLGVVTTAAKEEKDVLGAIREAVHLMTTLNRPACEAMVEIGVHAATDVTGFGLLGHLRAMMKASHARATIWLDKVPRIAAAERYLRDGIAPPATHANRRFLADWVDWGDTDETAQLLLADAQTSGGLLIAVAEADTEPLLNAMRRRRAPPATVVGVVARAAPDQAGRITVVPHP